MREHHKPTTQLHATGSETRGVDNQEGAKVMMPSPHFIAAQFLSMSNSERFRRKASLNLSD